MKPKEQQRTIVSLALGASALLAVLGGCASGGAQVPSAGPGATEVSPALVLASGWSAPPLAGGHAGYAWEMSRNDAALGIGGPSRPTTAQRLEVRTMDRQWTSNGRVRENSRTFTRSLRRGSLISD